MTDPLAEYGPVASKREVVSVKPIPEGEWTARHGGWDKDPDPMHPEWCEIRMLDANGGYAGDIYGHFGIRIGRLIAAAPDMRRAVIELLYHSQGPEAIGRAAAALRKAETGE